MKHIAFQALASKKLGGSKTRFLWQDHAPCNHEVLGEIQKP